MAIAIVEDLWGRIRAHIDDKITAAEAAAESAVAAAQLASTGVQADTVGRVHLTPELRGEIDEKVTAEHEHTIEQVTGLDTALDGKSDVGHRHSWDQVDDKPATFPPTIGTTPDTAAAGDHTHTAAEVGAAPADHSHTPASIGAAPASHSHPEYATTERVNARTPEVRVVSSADQATTPGVVYLVTG